MRASSSSAAALSRGLFRGLSFVLRAPDEEVRNLIVKNGGSVLRVQDMEDDTIVLYSRSSREQPDRDEFGEGHWKVFSDWVSTCLLENEIVNVTSSNDDGETFLAARYPNGVHNPVLSRMKNEFSPDDDESLKQYAILCERKGFNLAELTAWEHVAKQRNNPLSRFTAEKLRDRYISFGVSPVKNKLAQFMRGQDRDSAVTKGQGRPSPRPVIKQSVPSNHIEISDDDDEEISPKRFRRDTQEKDYASQQQKPITKAVPEKSASLVESIPESSNFAKYSRSESQKMIQFARENPTLNQSEMWTKAYEEGLCPGRSAHSMRRHYKKLDERLNRTHPVVSTRTRNFTYEDDKMLFLWIYHWKEENGSDGIWGKRIWEAAEAQRILLDRTSEQMFNRFHNSLRKRLEEGLVDALKNATDMGWSIPPKSPKKPAKISSTGSVVSGASDASKTVREILEGIQIDPAKEEAAQPVPVFGQEQTQYVGELVERIVNASDGKSMADVIKALYFTCCDENAALRVLNGEALDSKFDLWTVEEDNRLLEGKSVNRPDTHKRRIFLGIEPRGGY